MLISYFIKKPIIKDTVADRDRIMNIIYEQQMMQALFRLNSWGDEFKQVFVIS